MLRIHFNKIVFSLVFTFLSSSFLNGCIAEYNLATNRQEFILMSSDTEVKLGRSISKGIEDKYKLIKDRELTERVDRIGEKLAKVCDRKAITYYFKVLDDEEVNAVSLPGGYIYVNKGLIDEVNTDDELAGVIAHEIGHIAARHAVKRLQGMIGYTTLSLLISGRGNLNQLRRGADMAFGELIMSYSREDEILADRLAVKYVKKAGYDPSAMLVLLTKLKEIDRKKPLMPKRYYRTHPYIYERMTAVKEEVFGKIEFDDYINIDENTL